MSEPNRSRVFTSEQLWRGATHAWLAFMVLLATATVAWTLAAGSAPFDPSTLTMAAYAAVWVAFFGGLVSMVVTIVGLPVAAAVGYALRRVRRGWIHLGVFAVFGAVVGAAAIAVFAALSSAVTLDPAFVTLTLGVCAAARVYGRWQGARTPQRRAPVMEEEDLRLDG